MKVDAIKTIPNQINTDRAGGKKLPPPTLCEKCAHSGDELCYEHSKQKAYIIGGTIAMLSVGAGALWFSKMGRIKKK